MSKFIINNLVYYISKETLELNGEKPIVSYNIWQREVHGVGTTEDGRYFYMLNNGATCEEKFLFATFNDAEAYVREYLSGKTTEVRFT